MNDFCLYCTGNDKIEVITCEDRKCVFYKHRRANLEWQEIELERRKKMGKIGYKRRVTLTRERRKKKLEKKLKERNKK